MEIKTSSRFIRTAPDKIRLLAALVCGKKYEEAINQLLFTKKAATTPLIFTLKQAKDQAKAKGFSEQDITIKSVIVNEGPKLKRRRIRHQGRSSMILKRMSHINIVIMTEDKPAKAEKSLTKGVKNGTKS